METLPNSDTIGAGRIHCEECNSWVKSYHGRCPNCLHPLDRTELAPALETEPKSRSKASAWFIAVTVAITYIIAGLAVGVAWTTEARDWLGDNSSLIADPDERQRIDQLASLSMSIWVVGLLTLAFGGWKLVYSTGSSRQTRTITIAAMIGIPVIWMLISIWVIRETSEAADHSGKNWTTEGMSVGRSLDPPEMYSVTVPWYPEFNSRP